jgi:3D (Asp-Asp-Asp) domain-containing protein
MDTGPAVNGRHVDLYLWSCNEALSFGRRDAVITVLRLGWHPRNSRIE